MAIFKTFTHEEVTGTHVGKYNLASNSKVHFYQLGDTLIDTGPPNDRGTVVAHLKPQPISQILLTHHHEDHSGNVKALSEALSVPAFIHPQGIDVMRQGFPLRLYQKIFWGTAPPCELSPLPETIATSTGHTLVPIHTPGHCPDHVCFLEPEKKWLFSGDFYLATKVKMFRADEDLKGHLKSLRKILTYDFDTLFCGHQGVVPDAKARMETKLSYFTELIAKVQERNERGVPEKRIALELLGKNGIAGLVSFNHMSCINLVRQCLAINNA